MRYIALCALVALPACDPAIFPAFAPVVDAPVTQPVVETLDPTPPPPPPPEARTVEQFDTTTAEDRAEADVQYKSLQEELNALYAQIGRDSFSVRDSTGRITELQLSKVVNIHKPNSMSVFGKIGFYIAKFCELEGDRGDCFRRICFTLVHKPIAHTFTKTVFC